MNVISKNLLWLEIVILYLNRYFYMAEFGKILWLVTILQEYVIAYERH